jgi:RNA 2',3'-cyclic 3'-phosphodiesterase
VTEGAAKARLFVALEIDHDTRAELAQWRDAQAACEGLRPVPEESMHVTLCFLGWRGEDEIDRIGALVSACARRLPVLALGEGAWLPDRRRPRVLVADLVDPEGAVAELQADLSAALARAAGYEPERRRFRPHITVARVPTGWHGPADLDPAPARDVTPSGVTLFRSRLSRGGARYEAQMRAELHR